MNKNETLALVIGLCALSGCGSPGGSKFNPSDSMKSLAAPLASPSPSTSAPSSARSTALLGAQNSRGAYQEASLSKIELTLDYFTEADRETIESNSHLQEQNNIYNDDAQLDKHWGMPARITFQKGHVRSLNAHGTYLVLDEAAGYCFADAVIAEESEDSWVYAVSGVVTLVTADGAVGPFSAFNSSGKWVFSPEPGLGQLARFGYIDSKLSFSPPNAFGNGKRDHGSVMAFGCVSKTAEPITVAFAKREFGDRFNVVYPR